MGNYTLLARVRTNAHIAVVRGQADRPTFLELS